MTSLKVSRNYGSVLLLACRIPNVQFRWLALQSYVLYFEINCGDLCAFLRCKFAFNKSPKQCRFAHVTIAY